MYNSLQSSSFFHEAEADVILKRFKKHYQHMENERVAFSFVKNLSRLDKYVVTYQVDVYYKV
jgi:hypothetical protein